MCEGGGGGLRCLCPGTCLRFIAHTLPSKVSRIDPASPLLLGFKRTTAVPTILLCCIHDQGTHFTCARSRLRFVLVTTSITVITGTGRGKTQLVRASWHALLLNIQTTAAALAEQSPAGMPNPTVPCSAGRAPFTLGGLVSCRGTCLVTHDK